jgi:hypothetical protein
MKMMLIPAALIVLCSFMAPDKLIGRWERKTASGNVVGVWFKPDNTFEAFINKKAFVSGTYTLNGNIYTNVDNGCPDIRGVYKITFFSNDDSMRVELIVDSCLERGKGMNGNVYGRVKK